jgi:hypothetical protein
MKRGRLAIAVVMMHLAAASVVGCGGSSGGTQAGGDASIEGGHDATTGEAGASDAPPPPADGPFACGNETCQPAQYCVHVCTGSVPICESVTDAGTCPPGFSPAPAICDGGCSGIPPAPPLCEDTVVSSQCPSPTYQGRDAICTCPP